MYLPYTSNQYVTINALDFQSVADWNVNFLPLLAKDGNVDNKKGRNRIFWITFWQKLFEEDLNFNA